MELQTHFVWHSFHLSKFVQSQKNITHRLKPSSKYLVVVSLWPQNQFKPVRDERRAFGLRTQCVWGALCDGS